MMNPRIFLLFVFLFTSSATGQSFDRLIRPMVTLTDPMVMDQILSDLLILPPDSLASIQLVDVTANGYGPDDLLILNPTAEVHYLGEFIPREFRDLVAGWNLEVDYRYEALREESGPALLAAHMEQDASAAIAVSCVEAVERHYEGEDLQLQLIRDQGTVRLEMWDYAPEALQYGGAPEAAACEMDRQRFEMARPIRVSYFRDEGDCVEAWAEEGKVKTRSCVQ